MPDWRKLSRIGRWSRLAAEAKDAAESKIPDKAIAAYVELQTGKNTKRSLVNSWMRGTREPYLSQFFALCQFLSMDPLHALGLDDKKSTMPSAEHNALGQYSGRDKKKLLVLVEAFQHSDEEGRNQLVAAAQSIMGNGQPGHSAERGRKGKRAVR